MGEPVEGFSVELEEESNLFEWAVWIEGPKDTCYEGGVFQLQMKFPGDFPMSPPELKFISDFWHPNVYKDTGIVCISILHPPGEDEMSGELPEERWLPTQSVTTIILSVISLLNAPNFSSPANVDASVEWRKNPEVYKQRCHRLIEKANKNKPTRIVIPHPDTNPEEREKQVLKMRELNTPTDIDDFMHDDNLPQGNDSEEASSEIEESEPQQSDEENKSESSETGKKETGKSKKGKKSAKTTTGKAGKESNNKSTNRNKGKSKMKPKSTKEEETVDDRETLSSEQAEKRRKKKKCTIQ